MRCGSAPRPVGDIAHAGSAWDHTTWSNILFLGVAAAVWWVHRHRDSLGGGPAYAADPVCGMQVERANPGATRTHDGHTVFACSDRCAGRFDADPDRFSHPDPAAPDHTPPEATP